MKSSFGSYKTKPIPAAMSVQNKESGDYFAQTILPSACLPNGIAGRNEKKAFKTSDTSHTEQDKSYSRTEHQRGEASFGTVA